MPNYSPWSGLYSDDPNTALAYKELGQKTIGDVTAPLGDDAIHESGDIMDFLPMEKIPALFATKAAPIGAIAIGALKPQVKFQRLREMLAGLDPTEISPEAFGRFIKRLGPKVEETAGSLVGARDLDKYGTQDFRKIVAQKWHEDPVLGSSLIPPPKVAQETLPNSISGLYSIPEHKITLDPLANREESSRLGLPRNPDLQDLGLLAHETQHAIETKKYPAFRSVPELLGNSPKDLQNEIGSRMLEAFQSGRPIPYGQDASEAFNQYLKEIKAPYSWKPGKGFNSEFVKDMFGRNPYGAQRFKSQGHFKDFNSFEFEYPQKTLSIENILQGGEVHPDIVERYGLRPYFQQYKSKKQILSPWEPPKNGE